MWVKRPLKEGQGGTKGSLKYSNKRGSRRVKSEVRGVTVSENPLYKASRDSNGGKSRKRKEKTKKKITEVPIIIITKVF